MSLLSASQFNERVRRAACNQVLPSAHHAGGGSFIHRWQTTVDRIDPVNAKPFDFGNSPLDGLPYFSASVFNNKPGKENRLWKVNVTPGCVNDEQACIEYLAKGDPRGWIMPANYGPYKAAQSIFGKNYAFVDRPMWESDSPFVTVTTPSGDGRDLGGFAKVPDNRRPDWFRTEDAWEKDLYLASVFVSITPYRADPTAASLAVRGSRARRWRVMAGQISPDPLNAALGNIGLGTAGIASCELARLWLLRDPGKPDDDEITVQQLVYWDLAARAIVDVPFLELIGAAAITADLGLIALSLAGGTLGLSLAVGALGVETAVVSLVLANLNDIVAATSGVEFWTV